MHNRDNIFTLGNPTLRENPTNFILGEMIIKQALQIHFFYKSMQKSKLKY